MMSRYPLVLFCALLLSTRVMAESGYHATYKLVVGPLTVGEMERSFELQVDGAYRFVSKLQTTGLASIINRDELFESSSGIFQAGAYYPTHYTYVRKSRKKPRNIRMRFDRANASIETIVNGDALSVPLNGNPLDKLVYQAALMHDLRLGETNFEYRIADRGREKVYQPVVTEEVPVETKLGRFNTVKLVRQRAKDKRRTIFWCAPTLGYLPVRVAYREKDGKETIAVLTEYHRIESQSP
jgi:Protein of unknown function (DUF3108)